jgi:Recombination endonuclease VII
MEWYRANPERSIENKRRHNLKSLYGLSVDQYNDLLRAQHGACAICGNGQSGRLHVDHCHDSGSVRGLLCNRCNRAIGLLGDDPAILRRAISYLLRSSRKEVDK